MQLYQLLFPNSKKYIGITSKTAQERFKAHCWASANKNPVQAAIHKYGKENVVLTVLATVDNWELLCLAEIEAIEKYQTFGEKGYNLTIGGEGNPKIGIYGLDRIKIDKEKTKLRDSIYRHNNREKILKYIRSYIVKKGDYEKERRRAYYKKNKDSVKNRTKKYYEENKSLIKIKQNAYYTKNKCHKKEYDKKYRHENSEKIASYKQEWAINNRDKARAACIKFRNNIFCLKVLTGGKPIDETELDTYDLRLLKAIRERNTLLIQHYPVQKDRKELMGKFVADYKSKYPRLQLVQS